MYWRSLGEGQRGHLPPATTKKIVFATNIFWQLQKAVVKTSFIDGKTLSSTITRQILNHLWWQNEFVENAYYFCRKYDFFFWGKCSRPTFYDDLKMFVAIEVISLLCIVNIICIVIIFFVYLFCLVKILHTNERGANQNVDENIEDDSKEEDDSFIWWH